MKKKVLIYVIPILLILSYSTTRGQEAAAPEIFFTEKIFTAGEVMEGTPVEHTYTVHNRGSAMLSIQKVSAG
ncbi:MAG: DUF1573 domain-containing protein [Deltaproteobacteria bacterium]|nr:DUF1573 domain-containing protein [Deltaproteobacteria bacterium]